MATKAIKNIASLVDVLSHRNFQYLSDTLSPKIAEEIAWINPNLSWVELSTTERMMVRFGYETLNRVECPFPLHP